MRSVEARPDLEQGGAIRAVDNDDSFQALVTFSNGADGVLEGSRVATGYKGDFRFELIGSEGSLSWTMQRVNELELYTTDGDPRERGFTLIRTGPDHPPFELFLPSPLGLGYAETKVIEARAFLDALADGVVARPTIEDAVAVARLLEAVPRRAWVRIEP
jgi:predicted dehydrogenase